MFQKSDRVAKPFLKWAGGKSQLLPEIEKRFPFDKNDTFNYVEPFVGSGAVLFWVLANFPNVERVIINDINADLINTYHQLAKNVDEVISLLENWQTQYHQLGGDEEKKKAYYYLKREQFNLRKENEIVQAALLIFLNRTCFNGLYRVNRKNEFNVPIGSYKKPMICDVDNLRMISLVLPRIDIRSEDFQNLGHFANENTFFYFDPPYKPLNATSSFNSYAKGDFNDSEQIRLKNFCDELHKNDSKWLLSNSDPVDEDGNQFFDQLYSTYSIERVQASRNINSKAEKRGKLNEVLIRNY